MAAPLPELQVEFAGLRLRNPFLLASGSPTLNGEMIARAFACGWAGAVTKTLKPPSLRQAWLAREQQPMLAAVRDRGRLVGMQNIATAGSSLDLAGWQAQIPRLKATFPDRAVIGSIAAPLDAQEWQTLAEGMQKAGVDALELDVSCAHSSPQLVQRRVIGDSPDLTARVVRWVREVCSGPVIVKLPATLADFQSMHDACAGAGAAALSGVNTLPCLAGIDLDTLSPLLAVGGRGTYGGLSGPALKPLALRAVSLMARSGPLPVSGIGGVASWEDAAEFIAVGAGSVQLCTAVMWYGYGLIDQLTAGLAAYLRAHGLAGVSALVGRANERIVATIGDLEPGHGAVAQVASDRCQQCQRCVSACRDGAFQAISLDHTGRPVVDPRVCEGCGLCRVVCPHGAIDWQPRAVADSAVVPGPGGLAGPDSCIGMT